MNKTPSSTNYVIITGNQVFGRVLEIMSQCEGSLLHRYSYICNAADLAVKQLVAEQDYVIEGGNNVHKAIVDMVFEYFLDLDNPNHSEFYPSHGKKMALWFLGDYTERCIAATILAEICKEKQVKFYIKKAGLTAIPVNGTFAKAAQWVNNFEGFENTNAFSCFAINRTLGLNLNERPDELYFYERMFDCRIWTFNSKLSDPFGKRASYGEVNELRVLALCLAQAVWDSGDRLEPETT